MDEIFLFLECSTINIDKHTLFHLKFMAFFCYLVSK